MSELVSVVNRIMEYFPQINAAQFHQAMGKLSPGITDKVEYGPTKAIIYGKLAIHFTQKEQQFALQIQQLQTENKDLIKLLENSKAYNLQMNEQREVHYEYLSKYRREIKQLKLKLSQIEYSSNEQYSLALMKLPRNYFSSKLYQITTASHLINYKIDRKKIETRLEQLERMRVDLNKKFIKTEIFFKFIINQDIKLLDNTITADKKALMDIYELSKIKNGIDEIENFNINNSIFDSDNNNDSDSDGSGDGQVQVPIPNSTDSVAATEIDYRQLGRTAVAQQ